MPTGRVRGCNTSLNVSFIYLNPSPAASRRPLPEGEVNQLSIL